MYRKKTTIIIVMCIAILVMGIGYAILSTQLNINGSTAVTSNWQVEFSDIRTVSQIGGATNKVTPSITATTATFQVDLVQPGDKIVYEIDITNYGDIKAEIKGATYEISGSEAIYVTIDGIRKGTTIENCEGATTCPKVTATISIGYTPGVTTDPTNKYKAIKVTLDIGQYVSSNPTPDGELVPELKTTLVSKILSDNKALSDSNIDFSKTSSDTNGKGLYYTTTNTEDNGITYYFRGAVKNNYVSFAGLTWRIVRINEDGSIRLITQDNVGDSAFNSSHSDNAGVGYMYGTVGSSTYALTHANTNNSTIKDVVDAWYQNNLASYSSYLADAGFCNDRSIASTANSWNSSDTALGYGSNITYYGVSNRVYNLNKPQFACPQSNDLFTTSSSSKGNKALTYPIGLITADEVVYAGGKNSSNNKNYYLVNGSSSWTISPYVFGSPAVNFDLDSGGTLSFAPVHMGGYGVRPVINLKSSVTILGGNGTSSNPYAIA